MTARLRRILLWLVPGALICVAILSAHDVTEFSPDSLMFRSRSYVIGVPVHSEEWSTERLDDVRQYIPPADGARTSRWDFVYGSSPWSRGFTHGDAMMAYRLFKANRWDHIIRSNNTDEAVAWRQIVAFMRDGDYENVINYLVELGTRAKPQD